jgi:UDP-N-acetylmuramoyl-L-alanyl-D-glutamate--2,6-diaminopimelate ligase
MKLKNIMNGCSDADFGRNGEVEIQGISYSSKSIRPGYLFAALKGEKSDGVQFLDEALEKGAEAVLSENPKPFDFEKTWITVSDARKTLAYASANFYSHPSSKMKVIGITGTKGKTTTTYLLESILKQAKFAPGVIGTISYRGPHMKIQAQRTTPEAPDLQRMMSEMLEQGATHCMIEVSSHSLELKRVAGIDFDLVVFTNLSGEHLDYHHSMEKYFEAKKKLFFPGENKRKSIINSDDRWGKKLLSELSSETIAYGLRSPADICAENYRFSENGIDFSVQHPSGNLALSSPLLGKPNLYNLLAAITCALALNLPEAAIETGISSLHHVPGRFEKIENSLKLNIFVDYAHTDDALRNLLETARELSQKRVILVFGAGGDRDKTKRPRMGEAAGSLADWTIITSDNPRSEPPMAIISEIEKGIKKTGAQKYSIQPDRREAIKQALSLARENDFVLVAGKGHEDYQIIQNKILPFDDVVIIREILEDMEKRQ